MAGSDFGLKNARIAIIGLGLMGGSLALSLKGKAGELRAFDPDRSTVELAKQQKIVDFASSDPEKVFESVEIIVLSCPVFDILNWIEVLPEFVQHPCVVLDMGSTKRMIVEAFSGLPENFDPIGGHAICGSERLSLENASPSLYHNATFVLTPLSRTSDAAKKAAVQIVESLNAHPVWLDADEHDRILAATSHLPYLLSSAITLATTKEEGALIGPGFRSTARLAGTPSNMMLDVILSNRDNVLSSFEQLQAQIDKLRNFLSEDNAAQLDSLLDSAQAQYQELI